MHRFLKKFLPGPLAAALTALWYLALLLGVIYCALEPQAEFRYMNI